MTWYGHCQKTKTKDSRTPGMLRTTLSACSKEVETRAYLPLVCPQLEYSSLAWNLYTKNDINCLEYVQCQAAHFVHSDYCKTTHFMLLVQDLDWNTIHSRRRLNKATMFYKIQFNLVHIQLPPCFLLSTYHSKHSYKYQHPSSNVDAYRYSYYPRPIHIWKQLPASAVNAPSLETF